LPSRSPPIHDARRSQSDRRLQLAGDARQRVPQDRVDEVEPGAYLVRDRGPRGARAIREPQRRHLGEQHVRRRPLLARQQPGIVEAPQRLRDPLQLREHGPPLGLGRMRGQHQLHAQRLEQPGHPRG
jgi:hypothetical protein